MTAGYLLMHRRIELSLRRSERIYLNTTNPFAMVAVGLQGSGKSHTIASIVEACMLVRSRLRVMLACLFVI